MNQQDIDKWRIDPPEDSIPGTIPDWLNAFDKNIKVRKAFATIYQAGFSRGVDFMRQGKRNKEEMLKKTSI
jgi:hypothetical protein